MMRLDLPGKRSERLPSARLLRLRRRAPVLLLLLAAVLLTPAGAWASGDGGGSDLLSAIGISILAATVLAYVAYLTRQPLLLAYIAAGAAIGPQFGFGWVHNKDDIRIIDRIQKIAPEARIVATAESPSRALALYNAGADYVLLPNQLAARQLLPVVQRLLQGEEVVLKDEEMAQLAGRDEVIG